MLYRFISMKTGLLLVSLTSFLQKLPIIFLVVIATCLAYQLALLTWTFVPEDKPEVHWKPLIKKSSQGVHNVDTNQLQRQNLFGKKVKEAKSVVKETSIVNAPKTRLNLKLVGVVASTDPQYSSVIIENKGSQGSYFIDSKIDGTNAVIIEIYEDRTILDVKGAHQTLMLDGVETLDKQQSKKSTRQRKVPKTAIKADVRTVKLDRKALLKNPGKLTDYIRISPVRSNGEVKGYRVKPGKDKSLFEEAGLKSGDLAVELNGIDLTDTQQAFTLMKEFPTMTDMTLSVERNGQLHELYFSIPE